MPTININDAYILDETGAEVDKVTGLFTKNENATTGEKQMARLNIAAGGSNRNLLDNAYFVGGGSQLGDGVFPINQRGMTSYTSSGTGIDRWCTDLPSGNGVTLTASGVTLDGGVYWGQHRVAKDLAGETLTLSVMLADGTIYSGTAVYNHEIGVGYTFFGNELMACYALRLGSSDVAQFEISTITAITVKAMKLEKGTVSTLANDPPPDFGEELAKCYRRLWYPIFYANQVVAAGLAFGDSAIFDIVTPVEMAGLPQIALGGSWYVAQNGSLTSISGIPSATFKTANHLRVQVGLSSNITAYTPVILLAGEYQGDSFSAEL